MKALIVDDDEFKAKLLIEWLKPVDIDADVVTSYEEALSLVNREYSILFVDYNLGGVKTGSDFIDFYKQRHSSAHDILYTAIPSNCPTDAKEFGELESFIKTKLTRYIETNNYEVVILRREVIELQEKFEKLYVTVNAHFITRNKMRSETKEKPIFTSTYSRSNSSAFLLAHSRLEKPSYTFLVSLS